MEVVTGALWVTALSSVLMTGIIWMIQLVHYPQLRFIDDTQWSSAHAFHTRAITPLVMTIMTTELISAGLFYWWSIHNWITISQLVLVLITWGITALISVPIHNQLRNRKSSKSLDRLIRTNWFRTITWTVRSILLVYLLLME